MPAAAMILTNEEVDFAQFLKSHLLIFPFNSLAFVLKA